MSTSTAATSPKDVARLKILFSDNCVKLNEVMEENAFLKKQLKIKEAELNELKGVERRDSFVGRKSLTGKGQDG